MERHVPADDSSLPFPTLPLKSSSRSDMGESPEARSSNGKQPTQVHVSEISTSRLSNPVASLLLKPRQLRASLLGSSSAKSEAASSSSTRALPNEQQQSSFLAILPHDLQYLLATTYLDFDSLLALRQTCRTLHGIFGPDLVRRVRSKVVQQSLKTEALQYRDYRSIYPRQRLGHLWDLLYAAFDFRLIERPAKELRCYGCLEVKPLWCFVERMSNRGTGLGAKSAEDRMCKDCMRRYRNIEGEWWKENWVRKSDTIRKRSRANRLRQWAFEGQSLVNPEEEVGVCASCGGGAFELWWGCVGCFELEEERCRQEDMEIYEGFERKVADVVESWRVRREAKRRIRQATRERDRDRRTKKWFNLTWGGGLEERKAALVEWKESKVHAKSGYGSSSSTSSSSAREGHAHAHAPWRALDQIPLPKNRRESRCAACWIPNCPRRLYILGLAYDRPMTMDMWCTDCRHDYDERHARRRGDRELPRTMMTSSIAMRHHHNRRRTSGPDIFSDAWGDGGLSYLFGEN